MEICKEFQVFFDKFSSEGDIISMKGINDENAIIFYITLLTNEIPDEKWQMTLSGIREFLDLVNQKKVMYNFIYDIHKCSDTPYMKLYEVQNILNQYIHVLDTYLHCSVIITQSRAMKMAIEASLKVYTPRRPLKILIYENDFNTFKDALQFSRDNRKTR